MATQSEFRAFKGKRTLNIYEQTQTRGKISVLCFGKKKAQAIVEHFEMIKKLASSDELDGTETINTNEET